MGRWEELLKESLQLPQLCSVNMIHVLQTLLALSMLNLCWRKRVVGVVGVAEGGK